MPVHTRNRRNGAKFQAGDHVDVLYNPSPNNMKGVGRGRYNGIIHKVEQIHRGEQYYLVNIIVDGNHSAEILVPQKAIHLKVNTGGSRRKRTQKRRRTHRR